MLSSGCSMDHSQNCIHLLASCAGAIKGEGLSNAVCVVVRYFGKIVGGLSISQHLACDRHCGSSHARISCSLFYSPHNDPSLYTGGIKLGAGGLIRAYGAAARQVLREAPTIALIPTSSFRTTVPTSSWAGAIYDAASKVPGTSTFDECYAEDGSFRIDVACHTDQRPRLQTILLDATRGSAVFSTVPASSDDEHVEQRQEDD